MNEAQRTVGRAMIEDWYRAAVASVEPGAAVRRFLARNGRDLVVDGRLTPVPGRLVVISVGKAAVTMARGVEQVCGDRIDDAFVLTKDGHLGETRLPFARVREAAHPVLDERGIRATNEILQLLSGLRTGS